MENTLKEILNQLQKLRSEQSEMRTDITEIKSDVSQLKSEQAEMRSDINDMKTDISQLKSEQTKVRTDISDLRSEQTEMRKEVAFYYGSMMKKLDETKLELSCEIKHVSNIQKQHHDVLEYLNEKQ